VSWFRLSVRSHDFCVLNKKPFRHPGQEAFTRGHPRAVHAGLNVLQGIIIWVPVEVPAMPVLPPWERRHGDQHVQPVRPFVDCDAHAKRQLHLHTRLGAPIDIDGIIIPVETHVDEVWYLEVYFSGHLLGVPFHPCISPFHGLHNEYVALKESAANGKFLDRPWHIWKIRISCRKICVPCLDTHTSTADDPEVTGIWLQGLLAVEAQDVRIAPKHARGRLFNARASDAIGRTSDSRAAPKWQ
jgi:hypothetical protein